MDRNIKYKQVCRIQLFGDDDVNTNTNSQYTLNGITYGKRMRFTLNFGSQSRRRMTPFETACQFLAASIYCGHIERATPEALFTTIVDGAPASGTGATTQNILPPAHPTLKHTDCLETSRHESSRHVSDWCEVAAFRTVNHHGHPRLCSSERGTDGVTD